MGVAHGVLVAVCGVVGAVGVVLVVLPARQARLRGWLERAGVEHDDAAVLAVQAALSRGAVVAAGVLVALALAFLALSLKAVGLVLALALAALVVTAWPVGGGARRRAGLTAAAPRLGSVRPLLVLLVAGLVVAAGLVLVQVVAFRPEEPVSGLAVDFSTVLPELAVYTLPVLAVVAVVVPVVVGAALLVIARRSGLSGATGRVDVLLRRYQARLALHAGAAAELVLAGVLVRFLPLLVDRPTPVDFGGGPVQGAGVLALVLVAAALVVLVRGAVLPAGRRRALEPVEAR